MLQLRKRIADFLYPRPALPARARPGQDVEASTWLWAPKSGNEASTLAMYAYNAWVQTAVSRLATRAATAAMTVIARSDPNKSYPEHPLCDLLGEYGKPNSGQTAIEFWETHFSQLDLAGNVYWFWSTPRMGAPDEVHLLEPWQVKLVPGRADTVAKYIYTVQGHEFPLDPVQVTHFRRTNPYDRYYGLSALQALQIEIQSDRSMALWNNQFFGEDVGIPAGIWVIPTSVSDAERDRLSDEINARHGARRRTAVVRGDPGSTVYLPAGIAPKDMDFTQGRLLSRQVVYEALELPLGLMSEASTEAHARVAERQLAEAGRMRHVRAARKLTADALGFWPGWRQKAVSFEDLTLRSADWDRESKHLAAVKPFMTVNEVRQQILRLPAVPWGEHEEPTSVEQQPDSGDIDTVQPTRQVPDLVESGE